ncbi:MAG: phosphatase PAP2 family protein [Proteobacteria bacterium]|nr:phosphatase PAP2 family protein [Pseudomonadota bacterium]MBU1595583.1 phosphatase PAP2 family protein [Pseudomonadota bacterium]
MSSRTPSPLAAWALLSLPLLLALGAFYGFLGSEDAINAHFSAWRPEHPAAVTALKLCTDWGNPAFYLVYAGILARGLMARRRDLTMMALGWLAAQLLVSLALERLLKTAIGRPRPDVGGPFRPWSLDAGHHSLPSGHTTEILVQTLPLALRAGAWLAPLGLGLVAGAMGASRVLLGWHHPTDVLAGWLLGSLGGALAHRLARRWT